MGEYLDITLKDVSVMVGMPADRAIPYQTVKSLLDTFSRCHKVEVEAELGMIAGCAIVTKARDDVVTHFLESFCDYLFWIDSDMEWNSRQFLRILALATKYDVVGASYPAKIDGESIYYVKMDDLSRPEYNEIGLMNVHGMGLGFTCVKRNVIEELALTKPLLTDSKNRKFRSVFRCDSENGSFRGEDMAFFADIRELGYDVWLDPSVNLGHVGSKTFRGDFASAFPPPGFTATEQDREYSVTR